MSCRRTRFILGSTILVLVGCRSSQKLPESSRAPTVEPSSAASKPTQVPPAAVQALADAATNAAPAVHFTGEVKQGETFVKAVAPHLVFRLNPNAEGDSGWRIEILPDSKPLPQDFDCSGSVTPPAHGPNDLFLDKPDGMSSARVLQWNAHQFDFVANPAECKLAWDLFNEEEYPSNLTDKQREADEERFGKILTGSGTLKILDSRLGTASANDEYGPILWLKFEVTLEFPNSAKAQAQ